jgi:hypothetical protein
MDFSNLKPTDDAVFVQLNHPDDGEPMFDPESGTAIGAYVYSADTERFKKFEREAVDEGLSSAFKNRGKPKTSAAKIEKRSLEAIMACIDRFQGIEYEGKPLVDDRSAIKKFLTEYHWVRKQVDDAIGDQRNFIKTLAKG